MDFPDVVLLRLADPAARGFLFDQDGLSAVAAAGYDHPELEGPYTAAFDEVSFGVDLAPDVQMSGTVQLVGSPTRHDVTATVSGLADPASPRLTCLWRGSLVARARAARDPVTLAGLQWTSGDPAPVAELRLTMADPLAVPTVARALPVTVAILARASEDASPGALLAQTAVVRERLVRAGIQPAPAPGLRRRAAVVVAWVLPASLFEDDGWPGGDAGSPEARRAARRSAAARWLAAQGVALLTVELP